MTSYAAGGAEPRPRLAVLLATYNGGRFLEAQLNSVNRQDWPAIDVHASDDGSDDDTKRRLKQWATRWHKGRFSVASGPGLGFADNFRALLADPTVDADYVAFCDQDDIWLPEKTHFAVAALAPYADRPALYCSRTIITDAEDREIDQSFPFRRAPEFANAVVQSIGGGNTMVFNRPAHELLRQAAWRTDFVSHDWFAYQLVSGAGGAVIYSSVPHVRYRQHERNVVGSNTSFAARMHRIRQAIGGRFTNWNEHNLRALTACRDLLTPEAADRLDMFRAARRGWPLERMVKLWRSGVYRQTSTGQVSLYVAGLLGKL